MQHSQNSYHLQPQGIHQQDYRYQIPPPVSASPSLGGGHQQFQQYQQQQYMMEGSNNIGQGGYAAQQQYLHQSLMAQQQQQYQQRVMLRESQYADGDQLFGGIPPITGNLALDQSEARDLDELTMHIGGDSPEFVPTPQQPQAPKCPQNLIFQYIKEDQRKNKSEPFGIELRPKRVEGYIAIFNKEEILSALSEEDIREDGFRIKFFNSLLGRWDVLEAELFVDINMGAFKPIDGIMTGSETAASQGILRPGQLIIVKFLASEKAAAAPMSSDHYSSQMHNSSMMVPYMNQSVTNTSIVRYTPPVNNLPRHNPPIMPQAYQQSFEHRSQITQLNQVSSQNSQQVAINSRLENLEKDMLEVKAANLKMLKFKQQLEELREANEQLKLEVTRLTQMCKVHEEQLSGLTELNQALQESQKDDPFFGQSDAAPSSISPESKRGFKIMCYSCVKLEKNQSTPIQARQYTNGNEYPGPHPNLRGKSSMYSERTSQLINNKSMQRVAETDMTEVDESQLPTSEDESRIQDQSTHYQQRHNNLNQTMQSNGFSHLLEKKKLDIAFLYSDPLIFKNEEKQIIAFPQTIDTEGEFGRLRRFLEERVKDRIITVKREAANNKTLGQIINERPTIIHISCHGDIKQDPTTKKYQYYLAFEDSKERGMLDQYDEDRLRHLLSCEDSDNLTQPFVKLVFVSACHSEIIGLQFKRAGVPIVIAVNQHTLIGDDVAREFSQQFYDQLLRGETPRTAFNWATNFVKQMSADTSHKFSCCCAHSHKGDCKWIQHKKSKLLDIRKACHLHYPSCRCDNKWIGKHYEHCSFYKKFHQTIQSGKVKILSPDELLEAEAERSLNKNRIKNEVTLCCCKEDVAHDETQKFMFIERQFDDFRFIPKEIPKNLSEEESIKYLESEKERAFQEVIEKDRQLLNVPLFKKQSSDQIKSPFTTSIKVKDNIEELNYLPCNNDPLKVFGRNIVVQEIVTHLDYEARSKLLHIYGISGSGKSAIAIHAAKYSYDRRFFPNGAYYIDFLNKQYEYQFVETIAECLQIELRGAENYAGSARDPLQELICSIKQYRVLLVLDNCRKFLAENQEYFNQALKLLSESTPNMKIIVVTDRKEQIKEQGLLWRKIIEEFTKKDAMALFWHIGKDHDTFKSKFKTFSAIEDFFFFKEGGHGTEPRYYNTQSIINIATLINEGKSLKQIEQSFHERLKEREQNANIVEQSNQVDVNGIKRDDTFLWTTKMKLIEVSQIYKTEIDLLYLLCQYPAGLLYSDIEKLCTLAKIVPESWKQFLQYISNETKVKGEHNDSLSNSRDATVNQALTFIDVTHIAELDEYHYQVNSNYVDYINSTFITDQNKKLDLIFITLNHLAQLSRRLILDLKEQRKEQIDVAMVGSHINQGVWSIMHSGSGDANVYSLKLTKPDVRSKYIQANFMNLIDLKLLERQVHKQDFRSPGVNQISLYGKENVSKQTLTFQFITEICINTTSILLMMERFHDVDQILTRSIAIANNYQMNYLLACLKLILVYRSIKTGKIYTQIKQVIDNAEKIFKDLKLNDGIAEAKILNAIALFQSIDSKQSTRDNSFMSVTGSSDQLSKQPHTISRLASQKYQESPSPHGHLPLYKQASMQSFPTILQKEMSQTEALLKEALSQFDRLSYDNGKAKACYLLAELYIEKQLGKSVELRYEQKFLFDILEVCVSLYNQLGIKHMEAKSLLLLSRHYFDCQDLKNAKEKVEKAMRESESVNDIECTNKCTQLLNEILDKFRIQSKNSFIFAKAFPIVEKVDETTVKMVGTFTKHLSDFRQKVTSGIKERNKVINVRFDQLNRELLEYVKNNGCRVLHISSDIYRKESLCIEGENGLIEYISLENLETMLKPERRNLQVDVVVLAIPDSAEIAKVFSSLGVPYVVAFEFDENQEDDFYMKNVKTVPVVFNLIYGFCQKFYLSLIDECTITDAFDAGLNVYNLLWREENRKNRRRDSHDDSQSSDEEDENAEPDHGPALFSEKYFKNGERPNEKLFDKTSLDQKARLNDGELIDTSRQRGRTNLDKYRSKNPMTGRQVEQYKLMIKLKNPNIKIINVHGMSGIGKTCFVVETAYYMHSRLQFSDGVFIVELQNVKTIEQLKNKMKEEDKIIKDDIVSEFQNKNTLFIFDNIDNILKNNRAQFDWYLQTLLKTCKQVKVIITTKKKIRRADFPEDEFKSNISLIKMKLLNEIEAADLILSTVLPCRNFTCEELFLDPGEEYKIHKQLQQDNGVKQCQGLPKYLAFLAEKLKSNKLSGMKVSQSIQIPKSQIEKAKQLMILQDHKNSKYPEEQVKQHSGKTKKGDQGDAKGGKKKNQQLQGQDSNKSSKKAANDSFTKEGHGNAEISDKIIRKKSQTGSMLSFPSNQGDKLQKLAAPIQPTIDEHEDENLPETNSIQPKSHKKPKKPAKKTKASQDTKKLSKSEKRQLVLQEQQQRSVGDSNQKLAEELENETPQKPHLRISPLQEGIGSPSREIAELNDPDNHMLILQFPQMLISRYESVNSKFDQSSDYHRSRGNSDANLFDQHIPQSNPYEHMNYHINAQLMNLGAGEDPYMRRIGGRVEPIAEETGTEYSTTNRLTETQSLVTPSTNKQGASAVLYDEDEEDNNDDEGDDQVHNYDGDDQDPPNLSNINTKLFSKHSALTQFANSSQRNSAETESQFGSSLSGSAQERQMILKKKKQEEKLRAIKQQNRKENGPRSNRQVNKYKGKTVNKFRETLESALTPEEKLKKKLQKKEKQLEKKKGFASKRLEDGSSFAIEEEKDTDGMSSIANGTSMMTTYLGKSESGPELTRSLSYAAKQLTLSRRQQSTEVRDFGELPSHFGYPEVRAVKTKEESESSEEESDEEEDAQ